jgi:hypothetical protein
MAQVVAQNHEFKPQYCQKKKLKRRIKAVGIIRTGQAFQDPVHVRHHEILVKTKSFVF